MSLLKLTFSIGLQDQEVRCHQVRPCKVQNKGFPMRSDGLKSV